MARIRGHFRMLLAGRVFLFFHWIRTRKIPQGNAGTMGVQREGKFAMALYAGSNCESLRLYVNKCGKFERSSVTTMLLRRVWRRSFAEEISLHPSRLSAVPAWRGVMRRVSLSLKATAFPHLMPSLYEHRCSKMHDKIQSLIYVANSNRGET